MRRIVMSVLTAGALTLGTAGVALADTQFPPEGGQWDFGTGAGKVWSDYSHPEVCHSSSVNGDQYVQSGPTDPGIMSHAETGTTTGADESYYATC